MKKNIVFITAGFIVLIVLIVLYVSISLNSQGNKKKKHYAAINKSLLDSALSYGRKNAKLNVYEFTKPWTINLGYEEGKGYATLCTPFLRLALLEREAVRHNEILNINIENKVYKQEMGIIHFLVTMYGNSPDFSKRLKAYLVYNKKVIHPNFIYFPLYGEVGRIYTQILNGEIKFPKNNIPAHATITLVVKTEPKPSSKWENTTSWKKSHTAEFKFELAKYH